MINMLDIQIIENSITINDVRSLAQQWYPEMIKGVCDVVKKIIALGGEMHADAETVLLARGSKQSDLWGFNIYCDASQHESIEFSSLINIRPAAGNRSIVINNEAIKDKMRTIIFDRVKWK
jgi:hypothetical protein